MRTIRAGVLLFVAQAAACGGGGNVTLENLGSHLASTACGKIFTCCTDAEIMQQFDGLTIMGQPITTRTQCEQVANGFIGGLFVSQLQASITAGRARYDSDAAGDCIASVDALSCADYAAQRAGNDLLPCRDFIIALVAEGGACTQDYECTTGACEAAASGTGDGACRPRPGLGQACTTDCATGLYCGYDMTTGHELCQAPKADGASCQLDEECTSDDCGEGGTCAPASRSCDGR
jgi:hypothetical protein